MVTQFAIQGRGLDGGEKCGGLRTVAFVVLLAIAVLEARGAVMVYNYGKELEVRAKEREIEVGREMEEC